MARTTNMLLLLPGRRHLEGGGRSCFMWMAAAASSLLLSTTNSVATASFLTAAAADGRLMSLQQPPASSSSFSSSSSSHTTRRNMAPMEPPLPNFCADCGNDNMVLKIPDGDERLRACCEQCGRIEYFNPKIVVSCVIRAINDNGDDDVGRILMAKRAIEPRKGTWGIPQGFMEHGETSRQAAAREVYEETGAVVDPASLKFRAVYNIPGSVQLLYEASVVASKVQQEIDSYRSSAAAAAASATAAHESLEVALVSEEELAEKELCFPTVQWALDHCRSQQPIGGASPTTTTTTTIQQMTKFYDAKKEVWNQFEDEAPRQ